MMIKMTANFRGQICESGCLGPSYSTDLQLNEATQVSAVEEPQPANVIMRNNKLLSFKPLSFVVVY